MALNHSCSVRPSRLCGAPSRILLFFHSTSKNFRRLPAPLRQLPCLVFFFFLPAEPGRKGNSFLIPRKHFSDKFFSAALSGKPRKKLPGNNPLPAFPFGSAKVKTFFLSANVFLFFFSPAASPAKTS